MSATSRINQPDFTTVIGTVTPGNSSNTAFDELWLPIGVHSFSDDELIWISDKIRLIRIKKSKFFNYVR